MSAKYFLDTNILIYSFDSSCLEKQGIAQGLIQTALSTGLGIISVQVVEEFCNAALKRFKCQMTLAECRYYVDSVLRHLCHQSLDFELVARTLNTKELYGFSFFDSMIIAAALRAGCTKLYTEDLQHHQQLGPLQVCNPFCNT